MFGDIITDLAAGLQGGLGMAASGNIHPGKTSMFEPVHGSAPLIAGKNMANPFGAILTAAMMLGHLGMAAEAGKIEAAVLEAVRLKKTTQDIGGVLGTKEAGEWVAGRISRASSPSTGSVSYTHLVHEPVLKNILRDDRRALGLRGQGHELRLAVGGKSRMLFGRHICRSKRIVSHDADGVGRALGFDSDFVKFAEQRIEVGRIASRDVEIASRHGSCDDERAGFRCV